MGCTFVVFGGHYNFSATLCYILSSYDLKYPIGLKPRGVRYALSGNSLIGKKFDDRLAFGSKSVIITLINKGPLLIGGPVSF